MVSIEELQAELGDARKRGNTAEVKDVLFLLEHRLHRPMVESRDFLRELASVRNRQSQRRHHRARKAGTVKRGLGRFPIGSLVEAPDGQVFEVLEHYNGHCAGKQVNGAGIMVPLAMCKAPTGAEAAKPTMVPQVRYDALYHAVWDYLDVVDTEQDPLTRELARSVLEKELRRLE